MGLIVRSTAQLLLKPLQRILSGYPPDFSIRRFISAASQSAAAILLVWEGSRNPPEGREVRHGEVQQSLLFPLAGWGIPCRMPRLPLQYFNSLIVIAALLPASQAPCLGAWSQEAACLPAWGGLLLISRGLLLISNAARGANCTCNGLNLTRLRFNYDCVRPESVA